MAQERIEAVRYIEATPQEIFAILSDPLGHVDIDASGMLMDAEGSVVSAVGDRFKVFMDREARGDVDLGRYEVEVVITVFEQDVEIAWTVDGAIKPPIGHIYGYRLEVPAEAADPDLSGGDTPGGTTGGTAATRVTSYYDWSTVSEDWKNSGVFPVVYEQGLKNTLGILERVVRRARPKLPAQ
jgi:hypothetical protein